MSIKCRQHVERIIARRVILDAKRLGFTLSVWNGGDEPEISESTDIKAILAVMFQTDDEKLVFHHVSSGKRAGWVHFVYGNDGWDVISDYSANDVTETIVAGAIKLADLYQ